MTVRAADPAPTISVASPVPPGRPRSQGLKPPCQPRPVILGSVIFPLHVGVVRYPEGHRVRVLYLRGSSVWHARGASVWHVRGRRRQPPAQGSRVSLSGRTPCPRLVSRGLERLARAGLERLARAGPAKRRTG